ncbi:MAG TPA: hypothetical protein VF041_11085 [Gemmatimonadaceae bacterium]
MPAPTPPPYSLPPHRFPFQALAAQAARAPLGGAREVALACLMAARLADASRTMRVSDAARAARAVGARAWFGAVAVPAPLRQPLARVAASIEHEGDAEMAGALAAVLAAARRHLEPGGIAEIEHVIAALRRS